MTSNSASHNCFSAAKYVVKATILLALHRTNSQQLPAGTVTLSSWH